MVKEKSKKSAALQNILIPAFVILFFLGVLVIYYFIVRSETEEKIIKSCEISSVSSSAQIDKILSSGTDALKLASYTLDNMLRSGSSQEEIHDFLINQTVALGYTNSAMSTGLYGCIRGEYLDGTDWVPDEDYIPTERPWYIGARANVGRVAVVDPYLDAMTGTITITFCKTLCDAKSVVAMDFSMELLQTVTEEIIQDGEADMEIVLDQNYQVIAHSDRTEIGNSYLEENGTFGNALVQKLRTSDDGFFSLNYEGASYIVYAVSITNDWYCISVFDATDVFSQMLTTLIFTILVSIIVVVILLALMIRARKKQESLDQISNVVGALAASIDAKDPYTNGHSGRVAEYAREISRRHGDSERTQDEIYMMGLLHDVGKIGIPDAVINKPGKLTDEEYAIIKTHPDIGSHILSQASGMNDTVGGARWHHERFDGKGYPDRLAGEQIPEFARIIAVADAYDAMTSRRSYRNALDQETVRKEIEKGRGTQFDPEIADIMLKMIDEDKDYQMCARPQEET